MAPTTTAPPRAASGTTKPVDDQLASQIAKWLELFVEPGNITEVRILNVSRAGFRAPHTASGYYDHEHLGQAAADAVRWSRNATAAYFALNPIQPDLLARAANRMRDCGRNDSLTSDRDILRRHWLLIDADPQRPAGDFVH